MKNIISKTVAAGMIMTGAVFAEEVVVEEMAVSEVPATSVSVTMDFASAYVFRGVTLNDGAVFQPGIEASGFGLDEKYGAVTVGAWGNWDFDDYDKNGAEANSFSETDWYGSYSLPSLVDGLDLFIGYTEYSYAAGSSDKEANLGAGYSFDMFSVGLTYYQGVGGLIGSQVYIEGAIGFALDLSEELSASIDATAGYLDPSASGVDSGFNDYSIGASLGYVLSEKWSAGVSVTYIGQGDDDVLPDDTSTSVGYDTEVVGMFSLACEM